MSSSYRSVRATLALVALIGLAGATWIDARAEDSQPRYEHRATAQGWQTERRQAAARQWRRAMAARANSGVRYQREMVGRSINQRRFAYGGALRHGAFAAGGRMRYVSRVLAGGQVRVVRYGNTASGTFERTIRPGLVSRTFVGGGHVLYAHAYQRHVWHRFGRAFAYETLVPAVRYPRAYYTWALAAWASPLRYNWGWQVQPWYPAYGALFTPYPLYTSPDLWMTDYIISQSLQTAYQVQSAAPAPSAPAPSAAPPESPTSQAPVEPEPDADSRVAAPAVQPDITTPTPQSQSPQSIELPVAPVAPPPVITPQIKTQLDNQIKVQLQEQQAAAGAPSNPGAQDTPPALRPNHVFFQVVQPLSVPSNAGGYCSLTPNDYIRRTGGMSQDDWMIPVVVELSGSADCPAGLQTRIGLNDLNAMENEQEAQVMEAMQAASKSMGPNGPPSGPGVHPILIATGSAAPDPGALEAIRQTQ